MLRIAQTVMTARPPTLSFVRMGSPCRTRIVRLAMRFTLITMVSCGLALSAAARDSRQPSLFELFFSVDVQFQDVSQVAAARIAFASLVREASPCASRDVASADRARCVVDALFTSNELATVAEPGDPESSTVTSALVSHRGNCAALTALALAVADSVKVPMEAVVFPRHVVVRAPGNPVEVFELLQRGTTLTMAQVRKRLGADGAHDTRVRSAAFPAFYLDNLAVRFAEAGDAGRAEAMFAKAIELGSRVGRIRFNYGTFLLGKDRLQPAKEQLRQAVQLDKRNAPAWANLGVAIAKLGDATEARRCFERALRVDPGNRTATENLRALGRKLPLP